MFTEAEWLRTKATPTIDDYMQNAYVSFALGPIVLPALYLVGPKLSDNVAENQELNYLFKTMSTCGRLLNDIQGFKVCVHSDLDCLESTIPHIHAQDISGCLNEIRLSRFQA
jgi:hypothetical protein